MTEECHEKASDMMNGKKAFNNRNCDHTGLFESATEDLKITYKKDYMLSLLCDVAGVYFAKKGTIGIIMVSPLFCYIL